MLWHVQDNSLTTGSKLKRNEMKVTEDEVLSPAVERLWMELIHPKLPTLVARTFACDLQRMTLKDVQHDGLEKFPQAAYPRISYPGIHIVTPNRVNPNLLAPHAIDSGDRDNIYRLQLRSLNLSVVYAEQKTDLCTDIAWLLVISSQNEK